MVLERKDYYKNIVLLPMLYFALLLKYSFIRFRLKLLWLTMTQPTTTVEVEFLPVYVPSEYEKQNPKAFAEGVRNVMAKYAYIIYNDYIISCVFRVIYMSLRNIRGKRIFFPAHYLLPANGHVARVIITDV